MLKVGDRIIRKKGDHTCCNWPEVGGLGTVIEVNSSKSGCFPYTIKWDNPPDEWKTHTSVSNDDNVELWHEPLGNGLGYLYDMERSITM